MIKWLSEIVEFNDLKKTLKYNHKFAHLKQEGRGWVVWFQQPGTENKIALTVSEHHPNGLCDYEIPESILEQIKVNIKYIPIRTNRYK